MSVYTDFGVNYEAAQPNWSLDRDYFNSIGLSSLRVNLSTTPIPWSAGTPNPSGPTANLAAYWRLCAQTFVNWGFWVTWGTNTSSIITISSWLAYHDAVVNEAQYLQSQGIALGDFEVGNELETLITNSITSLTQSSGIAIAVTSLPHNFTTGESIVISGASPTGYNGSFTITVLSDNSFSFSVNPSLPMFAATKGTCSDTTVSTLHSNIRQLAIDVKAVYSLSPISYACTSHNNAFPDWISSGLGTNALDSISLHPYPGVNTSTGFMNPPANTNIAGMVGAFGSQCYISEFNISGSITDFNSINVNNQVAGMNNLYFYLQSLTSSKKLVYQFVGGLNANNRFSMINTDTSTNPMWFDFFASNPTQYSTGQRADVNRNSVNRTSVPNRTSYANRPLFQ